MRDEYLKISKRIRELESKEAFYGRSHPDSAEVNKEWYRMMRKMRELLDAEPV